MYVLKYYNMIEFHNGLVILGGISFLVLPFILKIKNKYKVIFIICALIAISTSFFESSDIVNILAALSLVTPFILSGIKKDKLFTQKED